MLLEKKMHFWNNIGRCRFEEQNAGNPEKSGSLGALINKFDHVPKLQNKLVGGQQPFAFA